MDDDIAISFENETEPRTNITFEVLPEHSYLEPKIYSIHGKCKGSSELMRIEESLTDFINNNGSSLNILPEKRYSCSVVRYSECWHWVDYDFTNVQRLEVSNEN